MCHLCRCWPAFRPCPGLFRLASSRDAVTCVDSVYLPLTHQQLVTWTMQFPARLSQKVWLRFGAYSADIALTCSLLILYTHCVDFCSGVFEVGVHIADVTHFVKPDTALDKIAASRSTSVYLVQRVCSR